MVVMMVVVCGRDDGGGDDADGGGDDCDDDCVDGGAQARHIFKIEGLGSEFYRSRDVRAHI